MHNRFHISALPHPGGLTEAGRVLIENVNVRQEPIAGRRRWFDGDRLELVVWHDAGGAVSGFQLCYTGLNGERALTWRPGSGFAHHAVDGGDATPFKNETPVLVADGAVPWAELTARFHAEGAKLEPELHELVAARLTARE